MKKIILIPDVHGRSFWRDLVTLYKNQKEIEIIFLGDYLDPYSFEGITQEQAIVEFFDIINEAKSSNNITLLLGNHDIHYFDQFLDSWGCRRIESRKEEINKVFKDNIDLFKIAYEKEILGKRYLFTHAGILLGWFNKITGRKNNNNFSYPDYMGFSDEDKNKLKNLELTANSLNTLITFEAGLSSLMMISRERGGRESYGSCLWADIHEHFDDWEDKIPDTYQIFSHTLNYPFLDEAYFGKEFSMVDCRHGLELDCETGKITEIFPNDIKEK